MMNKRDRTRAKRFTENNKVLTRIDLGKCNKHCFASRMEAKDFSRVNKLDQRAYFCKLHKSWHLTKGLSTFVRDVANDKLLSVILLCNNFANAAAAAIVTLIVVEFFGTQESIIFIGTIITTFMIVIFSEISPKVIGAAHPEKLAPFCSFILYPLLKVFYPIVLFLNFFVLGFLKLVNIKTNFNQKDLINMDELKSIIIESGTFIPHKNKSIFLKLIHLNKVYIKTHYS